MPDTYDFGTFHLDAGEHLLLRDGRPVALPPKAFDLLLDLVQHAGHLRNKNQLMDVLWPGTFVEEANLAYTVSALRKALGDGREHPKYIETVPTKGYRFVGDIRNPEPATERLKPGSDSSTPPASVPAPGPAEVRRHTRYLIAAVAVLAVAAGVWAVSRFAPRDEPALPRSRIVTVTNSPGWVSWPSLSPDGHWIAYEWDGDKLANQDIYVKEVDGAGFSRLTTAPEYDRSPVWSPDGHRIAFYRSPETPWPPAPPGDRSVLYLVSPLGGGERKLAEGHYGGLSWSPDGTHIAFVDTSPKTRSSIWSLSVETLEKKRLTSPPADVVGDWTPAYSPDGRSLAFTRMWPGANRQAIYVMRLPGGEPTFLTDYGRPRTPSWTADSQGIVFATSWEMNTGLWRISVNGGEPQRVPLRGGDVLQPTISGNRLAYVDIIGNADIWRLELTGQDVVKPAAQPLISWSSNEHNPSISPDGRRIAFASSSSGGLEIWTSAADGTNATRLTDMITTGSPDWSPDGKWIAFDSNTSGNDDVYVVSADGGPVRQLTTDASYEKGGRWSRDGRWIYFDSFRTGSWQTWKMPSDGGKAVQVTKEGGVVSRESADGQFVYVYYDGGQRQPRKGVWRRPVSGGPETLVLDAKIEAGTRWDVTDRGIYFMESDMPTDTLYFYDFAARRVKKLGHLCDRCYQPYGPRVSPDGTWLLYSGGVYDSHIMMIDNFR